MSTLRSFNLITLFSVLLLSAISTLAEKHTIKFDNQCGHGIPRLIQKGNILSNGEPFSSNGPFFSGIAYLQTGSCLLNGEGCTLVEMSLINPSCPGCGSSTDISLIPPLGFSVPVTFSYFGGCEGQGATCSSANCNMAFFKPDDNHVQVACQDTDVNLLITFCPGGAGPVPPKPSSLAANTTGAALTTVTVSNTDKTPATTSAAILPPSSNPNTPQCAKNRSTRRRRGIVPPPPSRHIRRRRWF